MVHKKGRNEELIGVFTVRSWQRGRTFIVTVPKEVAERLTIQGQEKAHVYLDEKQRRINLRGRGLGSITAQSV